ncbi:MAG: cyclic nucleotide-binding domain-containing protein, partial [bacterium]|nr:cyclic nucleotide-binding domain-containing protein [bacterium]
MNVSEPFFDEEWDSEFGIAHREDEDIEAILRGIEIFSSLTREELSQIERIIHLRTYLPNEVIVQQGAPGVGMYIIQTGAAHVLLEVPQGEVIHLATLGERQFF